MAQTLEKKYCINCTEELEYAMFTAPGDKHNTFTIPFCKNSKCWRYGCLVTSFIPEHMIGKYRKDKNEDDKQNSKNQKT